MWWHTVLRIHIYILICAYTCHARHDHDADEPQLDVYQQPNRERNGPYAIDGISAQLYRVVRLCTEMSIARYFYMYIY